mmetsp:Transcript_40004/g.106133  ORF Transcript_40004/g.106133 Transcript_40004/m.106133 type:complete len:229 (-) Transcript_40004:190-876(-)
MHGPRLVGLLTRFKLPPNATKDHLRKAYYKEAKILHPDIAGEGSAAAFRKLQEDYAEANNLFENPSAAHAQSTDSSSEWQRQRGGDAGRTDSSSEWQRQWGAYANRDDSSEWQRPRERQWKPNATHDFTEKPLNFDPNQFRAGCRSHAFKENPDDKWYTYTTTERPNDAHRRDPSPIETPFSNARTPAQRLRVVILLATSACAAIAFSWRTGRASRAMLNQAGMPYAN